MKIKKWAAQVATWAKERGFFWTIVYVVREVLLRVHRRAMRLTDSLLLEVERKRFITGTDTISYLGNTVEDNKSMWTEHDWSLLGEDWTSDAGKNLGVDPEEWKQKLVEQALQRYLEADSVVLEIGPGAGRWTEYLLSSAKRAHLADITPDCLEMCKERFGGQQNIEYHLVGDDGLDFLGSDSIDFIWSYDVFVHINPLGIERYLKDFQRVLKSGKIAVIHHAGSYPERAVRRAGFRSNMSEAFFAFLVGKCGMRLVEQNLTLPHLRGDCISVFKK